MPVVNPIPTFHFIRKDRPELESCGDWLMHNEGLWISQLVTSTKNPLFLHKTALEVRSTLHFHVNVLSSHPCSAVMEKHVAKVNQIISYLPRIFDRMFWSRVPAWQTDHTRCLAGISQYYQSSEASVHSNPRSIRVNARQKYHFVILILLVPPETEMVLFGYPYPQMRYLVIISRKNTTKSFLRSYIPWTGTFCRRIWYGEFT